MDVQPGPDDVRRFPGADEVLAALGPALPQPDQLCGPFAAQLALHAVATRVPALVDLALAAGTVVHHADVAAWRPSGAPLDRTGWSRLPSTSDPASSGTDATGLAQGVTATCPELAVVPAAGGGPGEWSALLLALSEGEARVAVLANLRTGPVAPSGSTWDVGHFVVLWGVDDTGRWVAVADSYRELGAEGWPPGCRPVPVEAVSRALVGRGLLLLTGGPDQERVCRAVAEAGLGAELWTT